MDNWIWAPFLLILVTLGVIYSSKELQERWFAFVWMSKGEAKLDAALHDMKKAFLESKQLSGRVLDVGTGAGIRLKYLADCPLVTEVVCVEPNTHMRTMLESRVAEAIEKRKRSGNPIKITVFWGTIEVYLQGRINLFDSVACFLVLCSIPHPLACLRLLHDHCLKPGGRLVYVEHVAPSPSKKLLLCTFWISLDYGNPLYPSHEQRVGFCTQPFALSNRFGDCLEMAVNCAEIPLRLSGLLLPGLAWSRHFTLLINL